MLKSILNITGVKTLEKQTQKSISGGKRQEPELNYKCYCKGKLVTMTEDKEACDWVCSFY